LYYSTSLQRWTLNSVKDPSKSLYMRNKGMDVTPFGTEPWVVASDYALCEQQAMVEQELTLSICFPDKYTCNTGKCIPLR